MLEVRKKIWFENTYFTDIACLLTGLDGKFVPIEIKTWEDDARAKTQHSELKSVITHCTDLCEKNESEGR